MKAMKNLFLAILALSLLAIPAAAQNNKGGQDIGNVGAKRADQVHDRNQSKKKKKKDKDRDPNTDNDKHGNHNGETQGMHKGVTLGRHVGRGHR